jgi:hypothetical protein
LQGADIDGDGNVWLSKLKSWNDGKIKIDAYWLNETNPDDYLTGTSFGLRPGLDGSGMFGVTALVGFTCDFLCAGIVVGNKSEDSKPQIFQATLEIDGAPTYPS